MEKTCQYLLFDITYMSDIYHHIITHIDMYNHEPYFYKQQSLNIINNKYNTIVFVPRMTLVLNVNNPYLYSIVLCRRIVRNQNELFLVNIQIHLML